MGNDFVRWQNRKPGEKAKKAGKARMPKAKAHPLQAHKVFLPIEQAEAA